jgi:hypothetical protein
MSLLNRHGFWLKLALATALVTLADQLFYQRGLSHGWLGLFGMTIALAAGLALPALRRDRRALAALSVALSMAGAMAVDATPLAFALFWAALGLAILLPGTAKFDDCWRWAQRLLAHGLKALIGPLIDLLKLARTSRRRPQAAHSLRGALPALALPLAGSVVILTLFAAANPVIEHFFTSLSLPLPAEALIERLFFWGVVAVIVWGVLRPRRAVPFLATFDRTADRLIPGVNAVSVLLSLLAFNLIFAVQNAMDLAWLGGLMPLPDGMTLAEYAHRGAYPLIVTALLAALFVLATLRPGSQIAANPLVRRLVLVWIAQNVVLVAAAMLRLYDYIDAYSLTRLRIAAMVWMGLVAIGLALIGWRLLRDRSAAWLINANCAAAAVLLGVYAFVDTGAVAAQWNVRHAREVDGTGAGIDLCYLAALAPSSLLALIELEQRPLEPLLQQRVTVLRVRAQQRQAQMLRMGEWTLLAQYRLNRAETLGARLPMALPSPALNCSGQLD